MERLCTGSHTMPPYKVKQHFLNPIGQAYSHRFAVILSEGKLMVKRSCKSIVVHV